MIDRTRTTPYREVNRQGSTATTVQCAGELTIGRPLINDREPWHGVYHYHQPEGWCTLPWNLDLSHCYYKGWPGRWEAAWEVSHMPHEDMSN